MARKLKIDAMQIDSLMKSLREKVTKAGLLQRGKLSLEYTLDRTEDKAYVYLTEDVYLKIAELVRQFSSEVGWYGVAKRLSTESGFAANSYCIYDIVVPPQIVTGVKVDTDQSEMESWLDTLDDDTFNNLRAHGHSHVSMPVNPSTTDIDFQWETIKRCPTDTFYIYTIHNKDGAMYTCVYDMGVNLFFDNADVTVSVVSGPIRKFAREAASRVRTQSAVYGGVYYGSGWDHGVYTGKNIQQSKAAGTGTHKGSAYNTPTTTAPGSSVVSQGKSKYEIIAYNNKGQIIQDFYAKGNATIYLILSYLQADKFYGARVKIDENTCPPSNYGRAIAELTTGKGPHVIELSDIFFKNNDQAAAFEDDDDGDAWPAAT